MAKAESKKTKLTKTGFKKIQEELDDRKIRIREDIANKLQQATEQGDLSENAAYKTALEEKDLNESKIEQLENMLASSEIVATDTNSHVIGMGDSVEVQEVGAAKSMKINIVGKSEANPMQGMISVESPLGRALHGKTQGDTVTVNLPKGTTEYKVIKL